MCCARGGKDRCQCIWGESTRGGGTDAQHQAELEGVDDARTGMPHGIPRGAMCVQRFDDSLNSAIHTTYRISLRSSSMPEPRDPLLKVVTIVCFETVIAACKRWVFWFRRRADPPKENARCCNIEDARRACGSWWAAARRGWTHLNDPSAGSPTETLLRLLLPLNDRV